MRFVYIVERTDYDHHTAQEGKMAVVSVHTTLAGANEAAKTHMQDEIEESYGCDEAEVDEKLDRSGGFTCDVAVFEDERHNFTIQIQKMELHGASSAAAPILSRNDENISHNASFQTLSSRAQHLARAGQQEVICLDC